VTVLIVVASAVLAAVAAAGVLRPFGRGVRPPEPFADEAEDERVSALRALRDLEQDRLYGAVAEDEYAALRADTEARAVATLRALEGRPALQPKAGPTGSTEQAGDGGAVARRPRKSVVPAVVVGGIVVAVIAILTSSLRTRTPGEPITGEIPAGTTRGAASATAFFEQRVRDHPGDLAARLDLAERYLNTGQVRPAIDQFLAALRIDPQNTEARATLGFVIYRAGRPKEGLRVVNQALSADPVFPEALFFKGVILLRGLDRPAEAVQALKAYLDAAPFGSRRPEAQRLLRGAQRRG
jgi:cytochrome c-type biogenesis protein CcmH/NrfG